MKATSLLLVGGFAVAGLLVYSFLRPGTASASPSNRPSSSRNRASGGFSSPDPGMITNTPIFDKPLFDASQKSIATRLETKPNPNMTDKQLVESTAGWGNDLTNLALSILPPPKK